MTLPTIEVDGITIKPNRYGKYFCPHECGNSGRYPAASWKTEKGIRKHMAECPKSNAGKQLAEQKVADVEAARAEFVVSYAYKYARGDVVHYVRRVVIKPRTDARGRKIRYEEVCRFSSTTSVIIGQSATRHGMGFAAGYVTVSGFILESDILASAAEADARAAAAQKAHDEHLAFSSFCR